MKCGVKARPKGVCSKCKKKKRPEDYYSYVREHICKLCWQKRSQDYLKEAVMREQEDMDPIIRKAMLSFQENEKRQSWNNKKCDDIKRDNRGVKPYKFGNKWGKK